MIVNKTTPHYTVGRSGQTPQVIVLHIIEGSQTSCDNWFANPISKVSAHYSVGLSGEVHQYVKESDTAWANGRVQNPTFSLYKPGVNPNAYTVSIEHEGQNLSFAPEAQLKATVELIQAIAGRLQIPLDRNHIIGHSQIYSAKPNCPSPNLAIVDKIVQMAQSVEEPVDKEKTKVEIKRLLDLL